MQRFNFGFPKAQIKLDELMVEFLFELKDYDKDQEENAQVTCHGVISMMKAFCNVQQAIVDCNSCWNKKNEIVLNINLCKTIIFPILKEIVME